MLWIKSLIRWYLALILLPQCLGQATSSQSETCRVLVIGSTGAGKSTLINALLGEKKLETSPDATGCTAFYSSTFFDRKAVMYEFVDTVGLNEIEGGTVKQVDALKMFMQFLKENSEGFNLIIFCMREERLTTQAVSTYKIMVKDLYSQAKDPPPPVLLFVGGMFAAQEHPQDWCTKNREAFLMAGYEEAMEKLDQLHCLSIPDTSPNPRLEDIYEEIRAESVNRAWALVESFATPECRPFYQGIRGLFSLGSYLWNRFVDLAEWIPEKSSGNLKAALGLVKVVPKDLWEAVKGLGIDKEDLADVLDGHTAWY